MDSIPKELHLVEEWICTEAKSQPNVVCAVSEIRKHMVVGYHGENCLPCCMGSEQLGVGSRAMCCSKEVHLLPFSLEWEFLKKNANNNNNTIIKNICSVCTVYQVPFYGLLFILTIKSLQHHIGIIIIIPILRGGSLETKQLAKDRNQKSNFGSSGADFPTNRLWAQSKSLPGSASVPSLPPPLDEALCQLPESQKTLDLWLGEE